MKQLVITERENLVAIANAVRANSDITNEISLDGIASGINYVANYVAANTGGIDTSDATASAGDILQGETAYADGQKITGTFTLDSELTTQDNLIAQIQNAVDSLPEASGEPVLQTKTVTPTTSAQNITPDGGYDGLSKVTVNAIPSTYVKPTTTKAATTYTPTTSNQTIAAGTYCSGAQTIKGDANLKAENIAEGVNIFGITGTHSGGSGGGIEYEIVNLTKEGTSIPFTLKRVTSTFGMMTTSGQGGLSAKNAAHYNLSGMSAVYMGSVSSFLRGLSFEKGVLTSGSNFIAPYVAVFINDPSAEAIYEE